MIDEADKAPINVTCVLKTLVENGEMVLGDGRRVVPGRKKKLSIFLYVYDPITALPKALGMTCGQMISYFRSEVTVKRFMTNAMSVDSLVTY